MSRHYPHAAHIFHPVHNWKPEVREGADGSHSKHLVVHEQVALQVNVLTAQIKAAVEAYCLERAVSDENIHTLTFAIHLAIDELFPNMLKYGHQGDPNKKLTVDWGIEGDMFGMHTKEEGPGFDVKAAMAYDPTDPANIENTDGRGMFLVKGFMDDVQHNENGTEFTMLKRLVVKAEEAA